MNELSEPQLRTDGCARRHAIWALLLLVPVPTISTWIGLEGDMGTFGQTIFMLGKAWITILPVAWLILVDRRRPRLPRPCRAGMGWAIGTGLVFFAAIGVTFLLVGRSWIDVDAVVEVAQKNRLNEPLPYIGLAIYVCTVNSILEEYVWRWFVFTRLELLLPRLAAVIVSGLLFTLHHIVALNAYFDWRVTTLGCFGVFVGGATWSWIYLRSRNIYAAYVSHVFADVIIFIIGWKLLVVGTVT